MYKLQTLAYCGWADLKSCEGDSDTYTVCTFATKAEAESELNELLRDCDAGSDDWRIVPIEMPADCDIYE